MTVFGKLRHLNSTFKNVTKKQKVFLLIFLLILVAVPIIEIKWKVKATIIKHVMISKKHFLPTYLRSEPILVTSNISAFDERKFFACFVLSAPRGKEARNVIRQTWGKLLKPIFLIGQCDIRIMVKVIQEAQEFNDIIIEDFVDTYLNLTIKTAFAMKNFIKYFKNSKYFAKVDDDVFLDVEALQQFVKGAREDKIIGSRHGGIIVRDKKKRNYVPEYLLEGKMYTDFAVGPAYFIPGKVEKLNNTDQQYLIYFNAFQVSW